MIFSCRLSLSPPTCILSHSYLPLPLYLQLWTEDPDVLDWVQRSGNFTNRPYSAGVDDAEWIWLHDPLVRSVRTDIGQGLWHQPERGRFFGVEAVRFFLNVFLSLECDIAVGQSKSNQVGLGIYGFLGV